MAALFVVGPGEVVVALFNDAIDHLVGLPLVVELYRVAASEELVVDLANALVIARDKERAVVHHPVVDDVRHRADLALLQRGDVRDEERVAPLPDQEIPVGGVRINRWLEAVRRVRHHAVCTICQVVFAQGGV